MDSQEKPPEIQREYVKPNILFLKGVTRNDYKSIEDKFDEKLMECAYSENIPEKNAKIYDKIPENFRGMEKWPTKTNLKCWNCDRNFETAPKFIPTNMYKAGSEISSGVLGNFCSFSCTVSETIRRFQDKEELWQHLSFIKELYFTFTGKKVEIISPGIEKTEMKQYGGDLSSREFREKNRIIEDTYISKGHRLELVTIL
jgi:hypothetical protein